ncbi:hypothetical protein LMG23994_06457 [Cupriavidus pinatubonensis]|uniref:Uncharacterized protein n=2 Tax=Cupriavidus pinatubonensis TaxID=248026 RepID=A0ABM8Y2E7_9BURK|nr:hypothetical protein [Cupriavidus pinatubonensis]CAG9186931.1 hypothetical protein LMG23994_06457 [Cupriavidus pinatubonensis]
MMEQLSPVVAIAVLRQEVTATRIGFDSTPEQRERFLPDLIDVRMLPIPDGTNQILMLIEGRELTGIQATRPSSGATSAA